MRVSASFFIWVEIFIFFFFLMDLQVGDIMNNNGLAISGNIFNTNNIEYGSTENGTYIKFPDGILICFNGKFVTGTVEANHRWNGEGPLYGYLYDPFPDFPVKFIETPKAYGFSIASSSSIYYANGFRNGTTEGIHANNIGGCYIFSGKAVENDPFYLSYYAVGKWKN